MKRFKRERIYSANGGKPGTKENKLGIWQIPSIRLKERLSKIRLAYTLLTVALTSELCLVPHPNIVHSFQDPFNVSCTL